jgi:CubicO group peptidase (beta-lactamase class C family)
VSSISPHILSFFWHSSINADARAENSASPKIPCSAANPSPTPGTGTNPIPCCAANSSAPFGVLNFRIRLRASLRKYPDDAFASSPNTSSKCSRPAASPMLYSAFAAVYDTSGTSSINPSCNNGSRRLSPISAIDTSAACRTSTSSSFAIASSKSADASDAGTRLNATATSRRFSGPRSTKPSRSTRRASSARCPNNAIPASKTRNTLIHKLLSSSIIKPVTHIHLSRRALLLSAAALSAKAQNLQPAEAILSDAVQKGQLQSAVLHLRKASHIYEKSFGKCNADTPFLTASITKTFTAAGVMKLADQGLLKLSDPASRFFPQFAKDSRSKITIHHLLTHTSGLPDMLPANLDLRRKHAPLSEFLAQTLDTPLLFEPGAKVGYSSMGILLASAIAEKITSQKFPAFLDAQIFRPLKMSKTVLGLGKFKIEDTALSQTDQAGEDSGSLPADAHWNWNSQYWRALAAPWGGAHSTAADIARFLHSFLHPEQSPLKPETARSMIQNQTPTLNQSRGLGFVVYKDGRFGHGGSTGTASWASPSKDAVFVLLTSLPARVSQKPILDPVSQTALAAL